MVQNYKYEINGVSLELPRPMTDAEMRYLLDNPGRAYVYDLASDKLKARDQAEMDWTTIAAWGFLDNLNTWKYRMRDLNNSGWLEVSKDEIEQRFHIKIRRSDDAG